MSQENDVQKVHLLLDWKNLLREEEYTLKVKLFRLFGIFDRISLAHPHSNKPLQFTRSNPSNPLQECICPICDFYLTQLLIDVEYLRENISLCVLGENTFYETKCFQFLKLPRITRFPIMLGYQL